MKERLDIVDALGNPTGETADRKTVHRKGLLHRTAHVWLLRRTPRGTVEVLLQRRAPDKDSFPGCWDISSAGHIPAGAEWIPSALRELKEELGLAVHPRELVFLGKRAIDRTGVFHGHRFVDRQISAVYLLPVPFGKIRLRAQRSEISKLEWTPLDRCIRDVESRRFPTCIDPEELHWIAEHPAAHAPKRLHSFHVDLEHGPESVLERGRRIPHFFDGVSTWPLDERRRHGTKSFDAAFLRGMVASGAFSQFGQLLACTVRRDTGQIVQTHWAAPVSPKREKWFLVSVGYKGRVLKVKKIAGPDVHLFRRVETHGPAYDFAERVNRALLDVEKRPWPETKTYHEWEWAWGSTLALGLEYQIYGAPSHAPSWLKKFRGR